MSGWLDKVSNAVEKVGNTVANAVDGVGSGFAAVVESFASVSNFGRENKKDEKKKKFASVSTFSRARDPRFNPLRKGESFTAQLPSDEFKQQGFAAEEDPEVKRQREEAFRKAAAEADKLKWHGGSWEEKRRETWSGQAERNLPGGGPVTYQQAILAQPMPVLSPLRGTNTPQGVRAIVDASVGTTTASFNPALGTPGVAIPSNATAGSLDASIKVNVTNTPAPAAGVTSSFAAMFD